MESTGTRAERVVVAGPRSSRPPSVLMCVRFPSSTKAQMMKLWCGACCSCSRVVEGLVAEHPDPAEAVPTVLILAEIEARETGDERVGMAADIGRGGAGREDPVVAALLGAQDKRVGHDDVLRCWVGSGRGRAAGCPRRRGFRPFRSGIWACRSRGRPSRPGCPASGCRAGGRVRAGPGPVVGEAAAQADPAFQGVVSHCNLRGYEALE